ncbi:MAG: ribosome silencing factor [Verrucomicrobiota bacterium]
MTLSNAFTTESRNLIAACCQALDDTKAEDIKLLDVSEISSITNFLILANANSEPHLRALKRDLDKAIKDQKAKIVGIDEGRETGWSVVDAFDVMIHLFTPEMRETYDLETLWKDAKTLDVAPFLSEVDSQSA